MSLSIFGSVPVPKKNSTLFNEGHELAGTFPLSKLCPVFFTDTIPGDRWKIDAYNISKLETLLAPSFQQVNASLLWFKVPKRLVFRHFKKWYSGGENGQDNHQKPHIFLDKLHDDFVSYFSSNADDLTEFFFGPGSLWTYLGLPVPLYFDTATGQWKVIPITQWKFDTNNPKDDANYIDIMPILAYHLIHDQYFRDQTLNAGAFEDADEGILKVNSTYNAQITVDGDTYNLPSVSGVDLAEGGEVAFGDFIRLLILTTRAWQKEYFTSALPTPQRGPQVSIDVFQDQKAPVVVKTAANQYTQDEQNPAYINFSGDTGEEYSEDNYLEVTQGLTGQQQKVELSADLSGLSPITIVAFRNLFRLQAFLEKNNVGGGRFIETILAHWGERVPDFTVQRAVHVRSTSIPIQVSEVTATANSSGLNSVVGDQAGRARAQGNLGSVRIYTHEPSFIFALYNVTCPPVYVGQGIPRMFQHITRFDEPWRDFQHIGEQAIKNRELYFAFADSSGANNLRYNKGDFGYQQRYAEYKYMPSRIVGDFMTSMSYWHMARMFSEAPYLNNDFVTQNLDERIFAVPGQRPVIADFFFKAIARRKLSKFSTPKLT